MHSRLKIVEDPYLVAFLEKKIDGMGSYKSGPTRDENEPISFSSTRRVLPPLLLHDGRICVAKRIHGLSLTSTSKPSDSRRFCTKRISPLG